MLGANGGYESYIRLSAGGGNVASYDQEVLSCNEMLPFWFMWEDGIIRVGKSERYSDDNHNHLLFMGVCDYLMCVLIGQVT